MKFALKPPTVEKTIHPTLSLLRREHGGEDNLVLCFDGAIVAIFYNSGGINWIMDSLKATFPELHGEIENKRGSCNLETMPGGCEVKS